MTAMKRHSRIHWLSLFIIALVFVLYAVYMAIATQTAFFDVRNGIVYRGKAKGVALACPVRWEAGAVDDIMSIADDAGISITFFITNDWAKDHGELIDRMRSRHEFALLGQAKNANEFAQELQTFWGQGLDSRLYMPFADADAEGLLSAAQNAGVNIVLSSYDVLGRSSDPQSTVERFVEDYFDGVIIRFEPSQTVLEAFPAVISGFQEKGVTFFTVSQLIEVSLV